MLVGKGRSKINGGRLMWKFTGWTKSLWVIPQIRHFPIFFLSLLLCAFTKKLVFKSFEIYYPKIGEHNKTSIKLLWYHLIYKKGWSNVMCLGRQSDSGRSVSYSCQLHGCPSTHCEEGGSQALCGVGSDEATQAQAQPRCLQVKSEIFWFMLCVA